MNFYSLDDNRQPRRCKSSDEYMEWHDSMPPSSDWYARKTGVGFSIAQDKVGEQGVSTVYLGLDHSFGTESPILWETMVFPGCDVCVRYCTYEEAMQGHREVVEEVRGA